MAGDTSPRATPHDVRDGSEQGDWWWFYCYRCKQWCERSGPWCELYLSEPLTSDCVFVEYPERARGVRWPEAMPPPLSAGQ